MDGRGVGGGGGHTAAGLLPLPSFCGVGGPPHVEDYAYSYAKQIGLFSSIARTARTLARLALRKRTAARVVVQQLPPFERRSAQVGGVDHRVEKDLLPLPFFDQEAVYCTSTVRARPRLEPNGPRHHYKPSHKSQIQIWVWENTHPCFVQLPVDQNPSAPEAY